MHSALSRLNVLVTYSTTTLFFLAVVVAMTSYFFLPKRPSTPPSLYLTPIEMKEPTPRLHYQYQSYYHIPNHYGEVHFNLTVDLRPLFHWNTKQIYAFLTLSYLSSKFETNEIVFWDTIISDYEDAYLELDLMQNKYAIHDVIYKRKKNAFIGHQGNITLSWSVVPHVGYIYLVHPALTTPIQFVDAIEDS